MQIHQTSGQVMTLLAINNWKAGAKGASVGIGNNPGQHPDWTFTHNAGQFDKIRLRVLIRPQQ